MRTATWLFALGSASILMLAASGPAVAADAPRRPDSGLEERVRAEVVQIDVTVQGPAEDVATLTAADFDLWLGGRRVREFVIDAQCAVRPPATRPADLPADDLEPSDPAVPRPGYLFYFDQHHLTFRGRARSLELARGLVSKLVPPGRVTIVSAGRVLTTFAPLTGDRDALVVALDRLEHDPDQWDHFPTLEAQRVESLQAELATQLDSGRLASNRDMREIKESKSIRERLFPHDDAMIDEAEKRIAKSMADAATSSRATARSLQQEEWWHSERALRRFSAVLARLADRDAPKAVVYFADTVRANAGAHYLGLVGQPGDAEAPTDQPTRAVAAPAATIGTAPLPSFEGVIREAAAHGVRLFTVAAQGLVAAVAANRHSSPGNARFEGSSPTAAVQRFTDAESGLSTLAMETGGRAFLKGVGLDYISDRILEDMACHYLLGFDPEGWPLDRVLAVKVRSRRDGVTVRARGQMVVRSPEARLTARLTAAFAAPEEVAGGIRLQGRLIPTGFEDGKYTALAQIVVPGGARERAEWDIGLSLVAQGRLEAEGFRRVELRGANTPLVIETAVTLPSGPWEVTAVAHDIAAGDIATASFRGEWPDPRDEPVTIGPITVLQPVSAAFVRNGDQRRSGSLGLASDAPVRPHLPTALVGIVCRQRSLEQALRVERRLIGDESVEFPVIDLAPGGDLCAMVSDVIPARTMTEGVFDYELRVVDAGADVRSGHVQFAALDLPQP